MEEQRKKFLLSRIKKEEQLITGEYEKIRRQFIGKPLLRDKHQAYIEHATHLLEVNTSMAANVFEYLEKSQVEAIFERINVVFEDMVDKYKKVFNEWRILEDSKDSRQTRQICEICHEKIESNKIENLKRTLDEESECRTVLIRKLIQDSQRERCKPLFTQDEDKAFRIELEKVFKKKELMLQTNINESSVFLETVENQITDFMLSFRNEFADWEVHKEEENLNWGSMMKGYINKKLANSFQNKMPSWIKKMHDMFLDKQPVKPKIFSMTKESQTIEYLSENETQLKKELEDTNNKLIIKRQALKVSEEELEKEKLKNKGLKNQLDSLQKYYTDKIYQMSKENKIHTKQSRQQKTESTTRNENDSIIESRALITEPKDTDIQPEELESRKNKKKIAKMIIKSAQQYAAYNSKTQIETIQKTSRGSNKKRSAYYENINSINMSKDPTRMASDLRLKKKVYNRDRRDQETEEKQDGIDNLHQELDRLGGYMNMSVEELKDEVKNVNQELENNLQISKMVIQPANKRREHSINTHKDSVRSSFAKQSVDRHPQKKKTTFMQVKSEEIQTDILLPESKVLTQESQAAVEACPSHYKPIFELLTSMSKFNDLSNPRHKKRLIKLIEHFYDEIFQQINQPAKLNSIDQFHHQHHRQKDNSVSYGHRAKNNKSTLFKQILNDYVIASERKNKSLHLAKKHQSDSKVKLPNISIHFPPTQSPLSEPQTQLLGEQNLILFIDDKTAYRYEQSFIQSHHQRQSCKPTPGQLQKMQVLYSVLESIRRKNNPLYRQLCSFIRYPFTSLKNKFVVIDIISELTFSSFCNYFLKILWFHRQCDVKETHLFCHHVECFVDKMNSFAEKMEIGDVSSLATPSLYCR